MSPIVNQLTMEVNMQSHIFMCWIVPPTTLLLNLNWKLAEKIKSVFMLPI